MKTTAPSPRAAAAEKRKELRRAYAEAEEPDYRPKELAEQWGVHVSTIYRLMACGALSSVHISVKSIRIPRKAAEDFRSRRLVDGEESCQKVAKLVAKPEKDARNEDK